MAAALLASPHRVLLLHLGRRATHPRHEIGEPGVALLRSPFSSPLSLVSARVPHFFPTRVRESEECVSGTLGASGFLLSSTLHSSSNFLVWRKGDPSSLLLSSSWAPRPD
jgi:hypothetical protein